MKHNKFSKWIERLLVLLPLFYVAISSAYVIFNKNAKDSYYAENINESEFVSIDDINDLVTGNTYYFRSSVIPNTDSNYTMTLFVTNVYNELTGGYPDANQLRFQYQGSNQIAIFLYNNNTYLTNFTLTSTAVSLRFELVNISGTKTDYYDDYIFYQDFNNYSFLNNVLPYSMSEFNKLGFGKLDFTSWFTNIFMNGNTNNVYVQFVNSYLNYFLLVEVVYFIPMIIYWFIHFGESVIEKFTNKEF